MTKNVGYSHKESEAVIGDKFVGLALDENNQDEETPDRVANWIQDILKSLFNIKIYTKIQGKLPVFFISQFY